MKKRKGGDLALVEWRMLSRFVTSHDLVLRIADGVTYLLTYAQFAQIV